MLQLAVAVSPRLFLFWRGSIDVAAMKFAAITASASPLNPIERQETTGEARNAVREWCFELANDVLRTPVRLLSLAETEASTTTDHSSSLLLYYFRFLLKRMCGRSCE
jgi:hypothetical protein